MAQKMRKRRVVMTAVALAMLAAGTGFSVALQVGNSGNRVQEGADQAALTALNVMVGDDGQLDGSRRRAAMDAAAQMAARTGATVVGVQMAADNRSLSLVLRAKRSGQHITATARYVAPGKALGRERLADLGR